MANERVMPKVEFLGRRQTIAVDQILWVPSGKISTSNQIIDMDLLAGLAGIGSLDFVHLTGDENIAGIKTFDNGIVVPDRSIDISKLLISNNPQDQMVLAIHDNYPSWRNVHKFIYNEFTSSEQIDKYDVVTIDTNGQVKKLDCSSITTNAYRFFGIYSGDGSVMSNTDTVHVETDGILEFDDPIFGGANLDVWADPLNPGKMTTTEPTTSGQVKVYLGFTLQGNVLRLMPCKPKVIA